MVRNPPEAPSATPRPPLHVINRPYFLRPFPPRGILEVLSVDFFGGGRSYSVASESKPSPARGRCPPELGRGGWSKPASPVDRQGFDLLGGGSSTQNQYAISAQRIRAVRVGRKAVRDPRAGASRPDAERELFARARVARWSRVSRREARPTAAAVEAWLVATKEDKQTG